jgi:8-oxo-dGTP pyrophosphatase MutT (NUDIX family)
MKTRVVAKTIVCDKDGKLLILRRSKDDAIRPGGTDLPGGGLDTGEEFVAGAIREMQEEVGLQLQPADLDLVFAYTKNVYDAEYQADINFVWLGFIAKLPADQTVTLSFEHEDFMWLTFEEAQHIAESTSLQKFLNHLKTYEIATELWKRS